MAHEYEVYQRAEGEKRKGWWTFRIDGKETMYFSSNQRGIERIVERIKRGSMNPGGAPLTRFGDSEKPIDNRARKNAREADAVQAFMTRGRLSQ